MSAWINGKIIAAEKAHISVQNRGFTLGDGLFETIAIKNAQPRRLAAHWARLSASAQTLALALPFSYEEVQQALRALIAHDHLQEGTARITVSRLSTGRGLGFGPKAQSHGLITTSPAGAPPSRLKPLHISPVRRNPAAWSCCHKTLSYGDAIGARMTAKEGAATREVLMLDVRGHVASASAANIFWWQDGQLYTPSRECGILPGTTRAIILDLAHAKNIPVHEGAFNPTHLFNAHGAFLTNALVGVLPVYGVIDETGNTVSFAPDAPFLRALQAAESLMDQ